MTLQLVHARTALESLVVNVAAQLMSQAEGFHEYAETQSMTASALAELIADIEIDEDVLKQGNMTRAEFDRLVLRELKTQGV